MKLLKGVIAAALFCMGAAANAGTIEMTVHGLVCGFCAQGIEKTLRKHEATEDVVVSLENKLVAVSTKPGTDISDDTLRKALQDSGYEVKDIARTERSIPAIRESLKAGK